MQGIPSPPIKYTPKAKDVILIGEAAKQWYLQYYDACKFSMVGQLSELINLKESLVPIKNLRPQVAFKCLQNLQKGVQSRMLDNMLWLEVSLVPFPPFHAQHH